VKTAKLRVINTQKNSEITKTNKPKTNQHVRVALQTTYSITPYFTVLQTTWPHYLHAQSLCLWSYHRTSKWECCVQSLQC